MKKTVWKLFMNFEKEEKWLNEMAARGLHLINYSMGKYTFEEGKPGEYIYRIELLENVPSHPESVNYIAFLEDAGIEHVTSHVRWVYFRKKAADGPFELYSDLNSRIQHYVRICTMLGIIGGVNLAIGIMNLQSIAKFGTFMPFINIGAAGLLAIPFVNYWKRMQHWKKEKNIRE